MSYRLFEVFGIELEYMLVKASSLKITPIVDKLMILKNGSITSDVSNGKIEWSNELVAHVVELKANGPTKQLEDLDELFHKNIKEINKLPSSSMRILSIALLNLSVAVLLSTLIRGQFQAKPALSS
jgi:carboxylate-amine ligase